LLERKVGKQPARYEPRQQRHYHICCLACGALEDLAVPYQKSLDRLVERIVRYRLQEHRMEFYGICPRCQARARSHSPRRGRGSARPRASAGRQASGH
jgi:Fur family transcriptional regulator, peroxide stress response regulator